MVVGLLLSALTCLIILRVPLTTGGPLEAGDIVAPLNLSRHNEFLFSTWNPFTGGDNGGSISLALLYGWFSLFGSTPLAERVLLAVIFFLIPFVMFLTAFALARETFPERPRSWWLAAALSAWVYTLSPWVAMRVFHTSLLYGYALTPLVFYLGWTTARRGDLRRSFRNGLILALLLGIIGGVVHNLVDSLALLGFLFLLSLSLGGAEGGRLGVLRRGALLLAGLVPALLIVSAFWLLPYLFDFGSAYVAGPESHSGAFALKAVWFFSQRSELQNVLGQVGYWWTPSMYALSGTSLVAWTALLYVLPAFALAALYRLRKKSLFLALGCIAALALFLGKGSRDPLGSLYISFIYSIPEVGWIWRDPDKAVAYLSFALSLSAGLGIPSVLRGLRRLSGPVPRIPPSAVPALAVALLVMAPAIVSYPVITGDFAGHLRPQQVPLEYDAARSFLLDRAGDWRTLWLPVDATVGWGTSKETPSVEHWLSDMRILYPGSQVVQLQTNLLSGALIDNRTNGLGKLLAGLSTKYVVFHNDTLQGSGRLGSGLDHQDDLKLVFRTGNLSIYENQEPMSFASGTDRFLVTVGGLDTSLALSNLEAFDPLATPLVYVEQRPIEPEGLRGLLQEGGALLILSPQTLDDLVLSTLPSAYFQAPFRGRPLPSALTWNPEFTESPFWTRDLLGNMDGNRYDFDLGKGLVFSPISGLTLEQEITVGQGPQEIWARVLVSPRGGNVSFAIGGQPIGTADTKANMLAGFLWKKVGELVTSQGQTRLALTSHGDFNAVNLIAIVPKERLALHRTEVLGSLASGGKRVLLLAGEDQWGYEYRALARADASGTGAWQAGPGWAWRAGFVSMGDPSGFLSLRTPVPAARVSADVLLPSPGAGLAVALDYRDAGNWTGVEYRGSSRTVALELVRNGRSREITSRNLTLTPGVPHTWELVSWRERVEVSVDGIPVLESSTGLVFPSRVALRASTVGTAVANLTVEARDLTTDLNLPLPARMVLAFTGGDPSMAASQLDQRPQPFSSGGTWRTTPRNNLTSGTHHVMIANYTSVARPTLLAFDPNVWNSTTTPDGILRQPYHMDLKMSRSGPAHMHLDPEGTSLINLGEDYHPLWRISSDQGAVMTVPLNGLTLGILAGGAWRPLDVFFLPEEPFRIGWAITSIALPALGIAIVGLGVVPRLPQRLPWWWDRKANLRNGRGGAR